MGAAALARYAEELVEQLDDLDTRKAGDAAVKVMRQATAAVIGGDLTMSGLKRGGAARIEAKPGRNRVTIELSGGAYTLADKGRRRAVAATARPGSALATPFGPRMAVRGSTTAGAHITDRAGPKALDEAADAIVDDLDWGR